MVLNSPGIESIALVMGEVSRKDLQSNFKWLGWLGGGGEGEGRWKIAHPMGKELPEDSCLQQWASPGPAAPAQNKDLFK